MCISLHPEKQVGTISAKVFHLKNRILVSSFFFSILDNLQSFSAICTQTHYVETVISAATAGLFPK